MNTKDRKDLQEVLTEQVEEKESKLRASFVDNTDYIKEVLNDWGITEVYQEAKHKEAIRDQASHDFEAAYGEVQTVLRITGRNAPNYLNYLERSIDEAARELKSKAFLNSEAGKKIVVMRRFLKEAKTKLIFIDQPAEVKELFDTLQVMLENVSE